MSTIIVCTDFSQPSKNAISFICKLIHEKEKWDEYHVKLLHIYDLPTTYSGEGIALTTIPNEMEHADDRLEEEWETFSNEFPKVVLEKEMVTGSIQESLWEKVGEEKPSLVVIGAGGHYSDLISWDKEILGFIRELPVPVLIIPHQKSYSKLNNIAFACNLLHNSNKIPFNAVKRVVEFTEATLHVLFVTTPVMDKKPFVKENEQYVHHQFDEVNTKYYSIHETDIVKAISLFVKEHNIDLLLVAPKKHGAWESLFQKDHAKKLVKLDALPILALRS